MERSLKRKYFLIPVSLALLGLAVFAVFCDRTEAGAVKSGAGGYEIADDSFTISGAPGIGGSNYWLIFAAGQPVGHKDLTGGTYEIEGGYVSGIEAVFQITKTVTQVESPVGYTGAPGDVVPGARINYKLEFTNQGEAARTGTTLLEDPVPASLTYAAGSIILTLNDTPAAQTDTLDGDACAYMATDSIHCLITNIGAGATGSVTFKAVVD